jgi:hypothetical protein
MYLPMLWHIAARPAWLVLRGSFLALAWLLIEEGKAGSCM